MIAYNTAVVLLGVSLLGACAGPVGSFAVLRRRALTGDALAHAALPGVCLAFLLVGQRSFVALLLGALASGILGVVVIAVLRRWTRIKEDAAIGIVLGVFFGAGIVLSKYIQNSVPSGSKAGLDSFLLGKTSQMIAQDVYLIAGTAFFCLLTLVLCYKELKLIAFDPDFARSQGWPLLWLDLLLMLLLAITVVIGLPPVGVVLIAALLILPGATARFWTDQLSVLLLLSSVLGALIGWSGALLSALSSALPAGPIIVLCGTSFFVISALVAPRRGLLARFLAQQRLRHEIEEQTLLRVLFELSEADLPHPPALSVEAIQQRRTWTSGYLGRLLRDLEKEGYVQNQGGGYVLTPAGLERAVQVAREHRLWQTFLSEFPDQSSGLLDLTGAGIEHLLPAEMIKELRQRLQEAGRWPQLAVNSV
jgi:manganese/zinc/iron transport system permease protein